MLTPLQHVERIMRSAGYVWTRETAKQARIGLQRVGNYQYFLAELEYAILHNLLNMPKK